MQLCLLRVKGDSWTRGQLLKVKTQLSSTKTTRPKQSACTLKWAACLTFGNVQICSWTWVPKSHLSGRTKGPLQGECRINQKVEMGYWNPPHSLRTFTLEHLLTYFFHIRWVLLQDTQPVNTLIPPPRPQVFKTSRQTISFSPTYTVWSPNLILEQVNSAQLEVDNGALFAGGLACVSLPITKVPRYPRKPQSPKVPCDCPIVTVRPPCKLWGFVPVKTHMLFFHCSRAWPQKLWDIFDSHYGKWNDNKVSTNKSMSCFLNVSKTQLDSTS